MSGEPHTIEGYGEDEGVRVTLTPVTPTPTSERLPPGRTAYGTGMDRGRYNLGQGNRRVPAAPMSD